MIDLKSSLIYPHFDRFWYEIGLKNVITWRRKWFLGSWASDCGERNEQLHILLIFCTVLIFPLKRHIVRHFTVNKRFLSVILLFSGSLSEGNGTWGAVLPQKTKSTSGKWKKKLSSEMEKDIAIVFAQGIYMSS